LQKRVVAFASPVFTLAALNEAKTGEASLNLAALDFEEVDRTEELDTTGDQASMFSVVVSIPCEEGYDRVVQLRVQYFEASLGKTITYGNAQFNLRCGRAYSYTCPLN
jgi:hypothetical protein